MKLIRSGGGTKNPSDHAPGGLKKFIKAVGANTHSPSQMKKVSGGLYGEAGKK